MRPVATSAIQTAISSKWDKRRTRRGTGRLFRRFALISCGARNTLPYPIGIWTPKNPLDELARGLQGTKGGSPSDGDGAPPPEEEKRATAISDESDDPSCASASHGQFLGSGHDCTAVTSSGTKQGAGATLRSRQVLTVLGFATPTAIYLWFLHHYTVNAIWWDQWSDAVLIRDSYDGRLSLAALWAQHNENRIFFPNLLVLAMSRLDSFGERRIEEYVSAVLLLASVALIIGAHKRRSPGQPWLSYCPIVILMLSVVQAQNILSGVSACLVCGPRHAVWNSLPARPQDPLFVRPPERSRTRGYWKLLIAPRIADLGCRPDSAVLSTTVPPHHGALERVGLVTTVVYFYHLNSVTPANQTAVHLPSQAIRYFFESIGDVLGMPLATNDIGAYIVAALGCLIVLLALSPSGRVDDTVTTRVALLSVLRSSSSVFSSQWQQRMVVPEVGPKWQ